MPAERVLVECSPTGACKAKQGSLPCVLSVDVVKQVTVVCRALIPHRIGRHLLSMHQRVICILELALRRYLYRE